MSDNEKQTDMLEEPEGKKRGDHFWTVIILGIVIVTAGALFTGNYLAKVFLNPDQQQAPANIDYTSPEAFGLTGSEEPGDEEIAARIAATSTPKMSADETTSTSEPAETKPAAKPESEKAPEPKPEVKDPAPAKIDIEVSKPETTVAETKPATETKEPVEALSPNTETSASVGNEIKRPPAQEDGAGTTTPETNITAPSGSQKVLYVLQLGVYRQKENAERMKKTLEEEYDISVYVAPIEEDGETRYRVQVGAFGDKQNAQKLGRELQLKGYRYYISEKVVEE